MGKNVLITGGTGFIGRYLTEKLLEKGYTVSVLSRNSKANTSKVSYYIWDVTTQKIEEAAIRNADYIVHLAGEHITEKRWSKKRKEAIRNSRIQSTQLIYDTLVKLDKRVEAFISASGIGYYGALNGEGICTESTLPANDFVGTVCQDWENAADLMTGLGIRTVKVRTGLVLGKEGGILKELRPIFKRGFGCVLGSGKQYLPWIHVHDLCSIYIEAIENKKMIGPYDATINDSTTNLIFSKTLASSFGYPMWMPKIPAFLIQLGMGDRASLLLTGRRVSSDKIKKLGFRFQYRNLKQALKNLK
ncbi:TIGR01777 family oxidoreductase [Flavobacterium adhaerens]|uniref:TIGR01777 family oxidoreductase n=1 Tax=Flavobacterium adhaerens TaxID=3149043 RepID=UPI0032B5E681